MFSLILATEAVASAPPGDDLMTISLAVAGAAMLATAVTTWIVTPKAEKH
jgi:hypothetical protein